MKARIDHVLEQIGRIILGKEHSLRLAVCCLLARGHLLIEDIPGVGKTTLARALARALGLEMKRVQFTSDLLPADILGSSIFDRQTQQFVFHPGPIFGNLVLTDEINRAPPKTQSALLEAMEERQVSLDGKTYPMPEPFFVIATQNPHHLVGTYPLPESQLDRFLIRIDLGFPEREAEREMLGGPDRRAMIDDIHSDITASDIVVWQQAVEKVHVSEPVMDYLLDLLNHSRHMSEGGLGLSPRAGQFLLRSAQAWALMDGREMILPEDVQAVLPAVAVHRLRSGSVASGIVVAEQLLKSVPVP